MGWGSASSSGSRRSANGSANLQMPAHLSAARIEDERCRVSVQRRVPSRREARARPGDHAPAAETRVLDVAALSVAPNPDEPEPRKFMSRCVMHLPPVPQGFPEMAENFFAAPFKI